MSGTDDRTRVGTVSGRDDTEADDPLVEVTGLVKHFRSGSGVLGHETIRAVDGVDLTITHGETFGLVGESGCGKSTLGRSILRLYEPDAGRIVFDGVDITHLPERRLRPLRRQMQMVFQDPFSSLNPRKRVGTIIADVLRVHGEQGDDVDATVRELMHKVGLPEDAVERRPRAFSGGQRQRIGVARALALRPKLVIADEPVSALDVSVQAQVVNLLADLQTEFGLTYVVIAHDLGLVRHISDRIGVMYLGKVVEVGPNEPIYRSPIHPYTEALLAAVPVPDPDAADAREHEPLEGDLPSPANPPPACRFHTRCPHATQVCSTVEPPLVDYGDGHLAACHHPRNVADDEVPAAVVAARERGAESTAGHDDTRQDSASRS